MTHVTYRLTAKNRDQLRNVSDEVVLRSFGCCARGQLLPSAFPLTYATGCAVLNADNCRYADTARL